MGEGKSKDAVLLKFASFYTLENYYSEQALSSAVTHIYYLLKIPLPPALYNLTEKLPVHQSHGELNLFGQILILHSWGHSFPAYCLLERSSSLPYLGVDAHVKHVDLNWRLRVGFLHILDSVLFRYQGALLIDTQNMA